MTSSSDGDEALNLVLSNAGGLCLGQPQTAQVTIVDDEVAATMAMAAATDLVAEGGRVRGTVVLLVAHPVDSGCQIGISR